MGSKGLDFSHKEVINVNDGRRLGFVQDVTANLETGMITSIMVAKNRIDIISLNLKEKQEKRISYKAKSKKDRLCDSGRI